MLKKQIALPVLLLLSNVLFAGTRDSVQHRYFSFTYANDVFFGNDRYLTQQVDIAYSPGIRKNSNKQTIWQIQQQVFTPSDIFGDTIQKNDRPYAAILSLSLTQKKYFADKHLQLNYSAALGAIGPYAFGKQTQSSIHKAIDSRQPLGWDFQIRSAPFIQLQAGVEKEIVKHSAIALLISGKLNAGTVYNHADADLILHLHNNNSYFLLERNNNPMSYSLTLNSTIRYVAYNGTLQGSAVGSNNPYTIAASDISTIVLQQTVRIAGSYKRIGISLYATSLTKEFKTGTTHKWGALEFTYHF
ncbi:MAG: lipid A deacylase LpxR family protein [Bacteroidota bacterium]